MNSIHRLYQYICRSIISIISVSLMSSAMIGHASSPNGLFGDYFQRMIGPCAAGSVLTGFSGAVGSSYGTRTCTGLSTFLGSPIGSTAPVGQAVVGFDSDGKLRYGPVNWSNAGTNIYYTGSNVGIGTSTPSQKLTVAGNILATAYMTSSDYTLKTEIRPLDRSLENILDLRGYSYKWISDGRYDIGLIAQEVEKVFPDLVHTDASGKKSVQYANLIAPIMEAIREQQNIIERQQKKIDELEAQNQEFRTRLEALESRLGDIR